ncbi:hypothetical protein PUN28_004926 [Cardiocondyla obscurior]|uniref:Uncharacterized protein n=1 Tax=Cardiocondyla obscurior TaxID=286306 RepID=A0AAW2GJ38_9HYME
MYLLKLVLIKCIIKIKSIEVLAHYLATYVEKRPYHSPPRCRSAVLSQHARRFAKTFAVAHSIRLSLNRITGIAAFHKIITTRDGSSACQVSIILRGTLSRQYPSQRKFSRARACKRISVNYCTCKVEGYRMTSAGAINYTLLLGSPRR